MGDAYETAVYNMEASKQQGEVAKKVMDDMAKCLEIARRISAGDKVPAGDEKRLMEYSAELYQMAKNAAMLSRNKKRKEYDSLWEDEDENPCRQQDVEETVAEMECGMEMEIQE